MAFNILHKDKKTKARSGILKTKSGNIETPFFMPVATHSTVKNISSQDLEEMGARAIISNALMLFLKPGTKIIEKFSGLGKFMNFPGITFTDSGGFQMYSKAIYVGSKDIGVIFKNPFNGDKIFMTPEKDMNIQLQLNSDVAMCLDSMPLIEHSKEAIKDAVKKTSIWAARCKIEHNKLQKEKKKKRRQLLFGISQGGIHKDLRKRSVKELKKIDFDGYSIGGLGLGETRKQQHEMIKITKKIIPENKPIYLMGVGKPVEILEAISLGVDIFDSRFPTRNARNGSIFTKKGTLRLLNSKHKTDQNPMDKNCNCFVCKNYSKAYLRHLLLHREGNGYRLASYHNLFFLQEMTRNARKAIKQRKFKEFLTKFKKDYQE